MARRRTHLLGLAVLAVLVVTAGIGLGGGVVASAVENRSRSLVPAAAALTRTVVEVAVVPARTEIRPGTGGRLSPGRSLVPLVAVLLALTGAVGLAGRPVPAVAGPQPLLARRHTIALRAPPSFPLA